jgi:hypothetical protein
MTGCSSIAFGATPRGPWKKSKNPTAVNIARERDAYSANSRVPGYPHVHRNANRARCISSRA